MVHLSGFFLVLTAQFTGGHLMAAYCFLFAFCLFAFSLHIRRAEKHLMKIDGMLKNMGENFRKFAASFERRGVTPFRGAVWLFIGMGISFAVLPLNIASASCAMLTVGDSLSTLAGRKWGRHKISKSASVEGSATFFISAFAAGSVFIGPAAALIGAFTATLAELLPKLPHGLVERLGKSDLLDDNWIVPLAAGAAMLASCASLPCYGLLGFCKK